MLTLVIGRNRKTGKDEILADSTVSYPRQKEIYESHAETSDKFDRVGIYSLDPVKRVFNPKLKTKE